MEPNLYTEEIKRQHIPVFDNRTLLFDSVLFLSGICPISELKGALGIIEALLILITQQRVHFRRD